MSSPARQRGFTLVEVLVATSILAIGLLGALTAFSMAGRVTSASIHDTTVAALAQEKLTEIRVLAKTDELREGYTKGDFGDDYPGFSWKLAVGARSKLHIRRAELVIYAPKAGRQRETRFSTALF